MTWGEGAAEDSQKLKKTKTTLSHEPSNLSCPFKENGKELLSWNDIGRTTRVSSSIGLPLIITKGTITLALWDDLDQASPSLCKSL
jgi:hypothetical protein